MTTLEAWRRLRGAVCFGFVTAALPLSASGQASPPLDAPWQIEGIELASDGSTDAVQVVIVGLGRAPGPESPDAGGPVPAGDELEWVTLIGTGGFAHASRLSIERRCEFLCGYDGPEECHWVGRYNTHPPLPDIGTLLAAIPGRLDLLDYTTLAPDDGENLMARLAITRADSATELLWGVYDQEATLRVDDWEPSTGRFEGVLGTQYSEQTLAAAACRSSAFEWLLAIDCGSFALLAGGGDPLLISQADYNSPKIEPLARFEYAGSRHYVVRVGAKAQDVIGFVSGEPAGWRGRFRPRDWASMC